MGVDDGRSTAGKDDLAGTGLTSHAHNLPTGSAAHNGIIHQQDDTVLELGLHGAELSPDALLPGLLAGQDEGTVDVTVLDEAVGEGLPKLLRYHGSSSITGLRDRDDHIDLLDTLLSENLLDLVGKLLAHVLSAAVHRDSIHDGIRAGEVNILEDVRSISFLLNNLVELRLPILLDKHSLSRENILEVAEAQLTESNTLGSEHVVDTTFESGRGTGSHDEGADTVFVTESQDSEASNHGSDGPATLAPLVRLPEGNEDVVGVDTSFASLVQGVGKDVEHQLAVGVGVHMTMGLFIEISAQGGSVDEVTVVREADAVGRVDVERLAFGALRVTH